MEAADGANSTTASPMKVDKADKGRRNKKIDRSEDDTDFQADESEDEDSAAEPDGEARVDAENLKDLDPQRRSTSTIVHKSLSKQSGTGPSYHPTPPQSKFPPITLGGSAKPSPSRPKGELETSKRIYGKSSHSRAPIHIPAQVIDLTQDTPTNRPTVKPFQRAKIPIRSPLDLTYGHNQLSTCPACHKQHPRGACKLKAAGVEHCGLCGLAHFGYGRTCPHIKSETQVREMLQALKSSPEKKELVDAAMKYLRGVKGALVQQKKREKEKAMMQASGGSQALLPAMHQFGPPGQGAGAHNGLGAANVAHAPYGSTGQTTAQGLPRREVQSTFHHPANAVPGSVRSHLVSHSQRSQQSIEDHDVENALRGFLGR